MSDNQGFGLGDILPWAGLPEVKDIYYHDQTIGIDGYRFVSCRFDRCVLVVSTSNFQLENCFIDVTTTFQIIGDSIRPVRAFNAHNLYVRENFPYFAPEVNASGYITIK